MFSKLYWDDKIGKIRKGAARIVHARKQKFMQNFVQKEKVHIYRMIWE